MGVEVVLCRSVCVCVSGGGGALCVCVHPAKQEVSSESEVLLL